MKCNPSTLEALESRNMMSTVVQTSDNTITDFGSSSYTAEIRWGDNGDGSGIDAAVMGSNGGIDNTMPIPWVSDPTVGFDTGWVYFKYTLDLSSATAQSSLEVDGNQISVEEGTGTIHNVAIRAGVDCGGYATSLQSVQTTFFSNGSQVDSAPTFNESANLLNSTTSDPSESITQVTTSANNVNKVVVAGYIRMQGVANQSPAPEDLFSDVTVS